MVTLFYRIFALFRPKSVAPATDSGVAETGANFVVNVLAPDKRTVDGQGARSELPNEYHGAYTDLPGFVEGCFFNWMAGQESENPVRDESFEHKIIDYLKVLSQSETAGANLIPRVPSVMVQLLKRSHEENVTGSELSQLITKDVVLVAAILNEVNSSFYKSNKKVTELSQAIMMLGHNRLRMVLAKISFTPVFNDQLGNYTKLAAAKLWDTSQQRALASYLLAKQCGVDPFMSFLAGLMQDVGTIVALRVFDRSGSNNDLPTSDEFRLAFQNKALILSTRIAQIWTLPESVTEAIHEQLSDEATRGPMSRALNRADFISKTCMLIHAGLLNVNMERMNEILIASEMDCMTALMSGKVSVANIM